jgi:hypothetical protein
MMIKRHDLGNMNAFWTRSLVDDVTEGLSMSGDSEKVNCPFTIDRSGGCLDRVALAHDIILSWAIIQPWAR